MLISLYPLRQKSVTVYKKKLGFDVTKPLHFVRQT